MPLTRPRHEHRPQGDPCGRCGDRYEWHSRWERRRDWREKEIGRRHRKHQRGGEARSPLDFTNRKIYFLDGEGSGHAFVEQCVIKSCFLQREEHTKSTSHVYRADPECARAGCTLKPEEHTGHIYTYLACTDETGDELYETENKAGLTTEDCLDWICTLPTSNVFGFSLGYDLTKILKDLPPDVLYLLNHEKLRMVPTKTGFFKLRPIYWRDFKLNYMNKRLTVTKVRWDADKKKRVPASKPIKIWDVFRFFQSKFTSALMDWKIATEEDLVSMGAMKDSRADFDKLVKSGQLTPEDIKRYCREECKYGGRLVRGLIDAHTPLGLELTSFYGAGSTASAFLKKAAIKQYMAEPPEAARDAIARAFFGGRFEIGHAGPIKGPIYNYDISSAYPYQITFLPCLAHGRWTHVTSRRGLVKRIENAQLACVHVRTGPEPSRRWGAFPWRHGEGPGQGTIIFPISNPGTWVWKPEYLAARDHWKVEEVEAWIYETDCKCQPFKDVPSYYKERCRIGKEGPGLILKLGPNSFYGKLAQSEGQAPFNSWAWAGTITSGCRGQLLTMLAQDDDGALMVATDGLMGRRRLTRPAPKETGTGECLSSKGIKVPLGGWEEKVIDRGVFLVRPGIYFPIGATREDIKDVKSRGLSKAMLLRDSKRLQRSWDRYRWTKKIKIAGDRFISMKSGVLRHPNGAVRKLDRYGEWCNWPIVVSFEPRPKRADIRRGEGKEAILDPFLKAPVNAVSAPYDRGIESAEARQQREYREAEEDQPKWADVDFGDEGTGD